MNEVVVVATARARAGNEAEVERRFLAAVEPTHREEGCLRYAFHRDASDPARFMMLERWTSREALDRHLASPHIATLLSGVTPLLDGEIDLVILEPLSEQSGPKGRI